MTPSLCKPQPAQVVFPHCEQPTAQHISGEVGGLRVCVSESGSVGWLANAPRLLLWLFSGRTAFCFGDGHVRSEKSMPGFQQFRGNTVRAAAAA